MAAKIERIDSDVKLPFDREALLSKDPEVRVDAQFEMVKYLQDLLEKIVAAANFNIDLADGEAVYYKLRGKDGEYPNGTFRRMQVDANLELQVKISGNFELAKTEERPL